MAAGEVTFECSHCGQKLRGEWIRCPRCRELVEQPAAPAIDLFEPAPAPRSHLGWMAASVVAMIALVVIAGFITSSLNARSSDGPRSRTAQALRPTPYPTAEPRAVDAGTLAQNESADHRRAGYAAYSSGDFDSALARFQAAVEADPNDAEARNNFAQLLVRLGRPSDALPHFDEAVRLNPEKWAYRFNRGRAHAELQQFPQAISDYSAAASMFPDDYATQYNLGLVYLQTRQYAEAVSTLERAVAMAPGEPSFLITLGTAYVGVEQPDKAQEAFETFLEVAADDDPEVPRVKALIEAFAAAKEGA